MYSALVYIVVWWLCWFMMLPIGIRSNENPAREEYPGAPLNPDLKKKAVWAALLSVPFTAVIMLVWNP